MESTNEKQSSVEAAGETTLEESSVTMLDVLEQEKEMEDEYAAVLAASDENCCTYTQGPVGRQALYSCLTCCPEARADLTKAAGVCLACSYKCHEHHELVELYTKRNFRCDCPTERFGASLRCTLNPTLSTPGKRNAQNAYNQNFQGLYCTCRRPYPDPDRTSEEVMLQCAICEDWFHLQHLDVPASAAKLVDNCTEMICGLCMGKHSFLGAYTGLALKALEDADESLANITVGRDVSLCEENDTKLRSDLDKSISEIMNMADDIKPADGSPGKVATDKNTTEPTEKVCADQDEPPVDATAVQEKAGTSEASPPSKRAKLNDDENAKPPETACKRPPLNATDYEKGATFWGNDWRAALCRCATCLAMYRDQAVEYLLDADDSAKSYEERGIKRAATESSSYEQGIRALASMGRVQQIDAITEYNRMKDKLKEYLQTFAESKKIVTEEDINRFFEQMRNEKNAQVGQPFFCR